MSWGKKRDVGLSDVRKGNLGFILKIWETVSFPSVPFFVYTVYSMQTVLCVYSTQYTLCRLRNLAIKLSRQAPIKIRKLQKIKFRINMIIAQLNRHRHSHS